MVFTFEKTLSILHGSAPEEPGAEVPASTTSPTKPSPSFSASSTLSTSPALFLIPLPTQSFLCCVALSALVGPWSQRSTARLGTLPNMPGDALTRAPPHLSIEQKNGFVCIESTLESTASPLPAGKPEEVEA